MSLDFYNDIDIQIICAYTVGLLVIQFFSKKRFFTLENRIFVGVLLSVFVANLIDIFSIWTIYHASKYALLNMIVCKLYLVCIVAYLYFITIYVFTICFPQIFDEKKNGKKGRWILSLIEILFLGIVAYCIYYIFNHELQFVDTPGKAYTYGPAVKFTFQVGTYATVVWVLSVIIGWKNLIKKKTIPIITYILVGLLGTTIQQKYPELLFSSLLVSTAAFIMYFTIQNPDVEEIEELAFAKQQAEDANKAKTEFLSSMSHEIRTPLNAIVGFSQILKEEELPPQVEEEVNDIISSANSLLEIVNGILDISKIEANKIEIIENDYNFKNLFEECSLYTKSRLKDNPRITFESYYSENTPTFLYGDYAHTKQIIINLLSNSIKYTKEGKIKLSVNSEMVDDKCKLIIAVEDTGIGIKEENINKLFKNFERLQVQKNISISGTGLGLAITKKLVEMMDGTIIVQSIYGQGSKFTISFVQKVSENASNNEVVASTKTITEEIKDFTGKKVLIVDDNKINLKVASRLLSSYNFDIVTCDSGEDAINKVNSDWFDLIFMDDMMPKMSGVETLQKLKEIPGFSVPVIALTANTGNVMKDKYVNDGFKDYLSKPIDKIELNRIINENIKEGFGE